jgi:hypothetical protein
VNDFAELDVDPIEQNVYADEFLKALPREIERPIEGVDSDGDAEFEWYRHPRWLFSVSISPSGMLNYAGLFGSEKMHGAIAFNIGDSLPGVILEAVQKACSVEIL